MYWSRAFRKTACRRLTGTRLKFLWEDRDAMELINPVVQNILSRRSIRKFTGQEIQRPILDMLLKAGYHAPSGHNMQTWRFTVLTRQADIAELKELTRQTAEENKVHFYGFDSIYCCFYNIVLPGAISAFCF